MRNGQAAGLASPATCGAKIRRNMERWRAKFEHCDVCGGKGEDQQDDTKGTASQRGDGKTFSLYASFSHYMSLIKKAARGQTRKIACTFHSVRPSTSVANKEKERTEIRPTRRAASVCQRTTVGTRLFPGPPMHPNTQVIRKRRKAIILLIGQRDGDRRPAAKRFRRPMCARLGGWEQALLI